MKQHLWKDSGDCFELNTDLFFDKYEEEESVRISIDTLCQGCPQARICFANGISGKEWGVWGGVYLEKGEISREFNNHKSKKDWGKTWLGLTTS